LEPLDREGHRGLPSCSRNASTWRFRGALSEIALHKGLRRAGFRDVSIEPVEDFGIGDCALYPLFNDELLGLLRRLVPAERHGRIARSKEGFAIDGAGRLILEADSSGKPAPRLVRPD